MAGFVQIMRDFWQDFLRDSLQDLQNSRKLGNCLCRNIFKMQGFGRICAQLCRIF